MFWCIPKDQLRTFKMALLNSDTVPLFLLRVFPGEMEKIAPPFLRRSGEVRWAYLVIFFLALGLGEVCTGNAWNLPSEGTGVVGCWLDSLAEGTGALAPVRLN